MTPQELKWMQYVYFLIRQARDEESDREKKDRFTNALAGLLVLNSDVDKGDGTV